MYVTEELLVQGNPMECLVFEPAGADAKPGMIVAQHLPVAHAGLASDPFTIDVGERLAAAGYVAVIPFLFHWWPREADMKAKVAAWRDDWNLADLSATFELIANHPRVDRNRIGIMGHCWGGRVAWLAACTNPQLAAAAMFYGGRIKVGLGAGATPAIDLADRIRCPVLGIFGNEDRNPSPEDVDELHRALEDAGVAHDFHRYDNAGHGFQDFTNEERYRVEQADDAWQKLLTFMGRHLAGSD